MALPGFADGVGPAGFRSGSAMQAIASSRSRSNRSAGNPSFRPNSTASGSGSQETLEPLADSMAERLRGPGCSGLESSCVWVSDLASSFATPRRTFS